MIINRGGRERERDFKNNKEILNNLKESMVCH
jgi:hypothetical protein